MKVLIIYQYFGGKSTMWSSRIYEMSKVWKSQGVDITIVTAPYSKSDLKPGPFYVSRQNYEDLKLIVVNSADNNTFSFFKRVFNQLIFSFFSIYYALTLKYDIIITSSGPIFVSFSGILAKIIRRKKFVFELRDKWPDGAIELGHITNRHIINLLKRFEKYIYINADLIVAASVGMKNAIKNEGVYKKIFVAPNACDKSFYNSVRNIRTENDINLSTKIFVYFGSIGLMDDVSYLVKGFDEANIQDSLFLIFGDGVEMSKVEDYINEKKVNNIKLMGIVPKQEIFSWLDTSYVSLIAYKSFKSLQDSSPNKLFDSLAFGIPVLHNTTGWIKELVDDNIIGISVNPEIEGSMSQAIKFINDNSEIREKFAKNATNISDKYFNRTNISNEYLKQMQDLL